MPVALFAIGIGVAAGAVAIQAIKASIKPPSTGEINRGIDLARKLDPEHPREVGVGLFATGGSGLYDTVSGPENKYAWRVTGLSDWEITGFHELWLDGEKATLSGDPMSGWVDITSHYTKEDGTPTLRLRVMSGTESQALDPELAAAAGPGSWGGELTANDRFAGIAHAIMRQEQVPDEGLTREPGRVVFVCEGAPVHDPSDPSSDPDDPSTWSRTSDARFNPALITAQAIRGWKRGGEVIVGAHGVVTADIDDDELETEADICDELKETDTGTEPQYRCGGLIRMEKDSGIRPSLAKVLASMDGEMAEIGGRFKIRAGADRVPEHHYDLEAIGGRVLEFDEHGAATQRYNETLASIVDPEAAWEAQPLEKYAPAADLAADDDRHRVNSLGLDMVYSRFQGTRIQRAKHKRSRKHATAVFELPMIAQQTEPLDWFTVTDRQTGQTNGVWEAVSVGRVNTQEDGCRVIIVAQEIDVTPWSWGQSDANGVTLPGTSTYPGGGVPAPVVPTLLLTPIYIDGPDTREPAIDVAATFSESPLESTIEFEWRQSANPTYVHSASIEKAAGAITVREGIVPSTEYEFRARLTGGPSRIGDWSDWEAVTADSEYSVPLSNDATLPSAVIEASRQAINSAFGRSDPTLNAAAGILAETAEAGLQGTMLNWIEDPNDPTGWDAENGFIINRTSGFEAQWEHVGAGTQTDQYLWFPHTKAVRAGVRVQAGADVVLGGTTDDAILEAVWYDSDMVEVSVSEVDRGTSGRVEGVVVAPMAAAYVRFRFTPEASGTGSGKLAVDRQLSSGAEAGQTAPSTYQAPENEVISRIKNLERTSGNVAAAQRELRTESRRGFAGIRTTMATVVALNLAVATLETELTSTLQNEYLTSATAASLYRTEAQVNSAIATYQFTVGAITDTISAHVTSQAAAIATVEGSAAFYQLEVAAGGGNPAVYSMTAGAEGSAIALAADALYMLNTVAGETIKAMEVIAGDVRVLNDLYVDSELILSTVGALRGGQTGYDTGVGFFLGYAGGAYKFSVGDPAGNYLKYDGATLSMKGNFVVDNLAAVSAQTGALSIDSVLTLASAGKIAHTFGSDGELNIGNLGGGRSGMEILAADGAEAFYVDDLGEMRLNGDALPTHRGATAPSTPLPGHIWWNTGTGIENRWNGTGWDLWGSYGATWGGTLTGTPANLAGLGGGEGIENTLISIGANGALAGGGGGTVTIVGLGYSGALNATHGATWGGTLTGTPANLAGLGGSEGIENTLISIGANGTLAGGGGGTVTITGLGYTGALNATHGATWGGTLTGVPGNLGALGGSEGIVNSLISIGSNGALSGGGGGQVTIGGLGYTGSLTATDTRFYRSVSTSPPGSPSQWDTWYQTDTNILQRYNGSTWHDVGNDFRNTNQLTDGALLGQSAIWTSVSSMPTWAADDRAGAGLAANGDLNRAIPQAIADTSNILRYTSGGLFTGALNATHGATWTGTLSGMPTWASDDRAGAGLASNGDVARDIPTSIANSSDLLRRASGGLYTGHLAATAGATWGTDIGSMPTWASDDRAGAGLAANGDLARAVPQAIADSSNIMRRTGGGLYTGALNATNNTGALADLNTVSDAEIVSSRVLLIKESSYPSTGTAGLVAVDEHLYWRTSSEVGKITPHDFTGSLASDTTFNSSARSVVASAAVTNVNDGTLIWLKGVGVQFQSPDNATHEDVTGTWSIWVTPDSRAAGSAIETGTRKQLWQGGAQALTFQDSGSVILMATDDLNDAMDSLSRMVPFVAGSGYTGTCYVHLCFNRVGGTGSDGPKISGVATTQITVRAIG